VTSRSLYLAGLTVVALSGAALVSAAPQGVRNETAWALATALAVQAPLGWWTLRSIGRPNFQLVWSLGMLLRFGLVGLTGLWLAPALGWQMGPALGTLVGAMMALLLVEVVSAMREHTWGNR
jgi:hypothetical protein